MSLPERILLLLLLFSPWLEGGATPGALVILHTGLLLLALAALRDSRRSGSLEVHLTWTHLAYAGFVAIGGLSFLGASYFYGSFDTWWDQCVALILMLSLAIVRPSPRFRNAVPAALAGLGVAQAIPVLITRVTEGAALSPSFLNPNHLATWLNVAALVAMERAGWLGYPRPGLSRSERSAWIASIVICLSGTVAVGSRGAILALIAILGIIAWRRWRLSPRLARSLAAATLIVAAAGALSVGHRFSTRIDPYRYDRPKLWRTALMTWAEAPLLGHGPGMYEHRAPRHNFPQDRVAFRYSKEPRSAHSQPLQILAEEGLAGLAALGLLVAVALAELAAASGSGDARAGSARAALMACSAVGIHSLVEMPFQAPAIPLALITLVWLALAPGRPGEGAAGLAAAWIPRAGPLRGRLAIGLGVLSAAASLWMVAVAGPFLSYAAARYAEAPGRPPIRIDLAARISERLNPWQPFLGYRRAEAALSRAATLSPPLFANASESLERTIRLEPEDRSAWALLASLYRRAAVDFPGAGPGAWAAAGRYHDAAIARAPLDARLRLDRATFLLGSGRAEEALADCEEAIRLEPRSPMARHLRAEALAALGRGREAAAALEDLDRVAGLMKGYEALNGYERSLLRLNQPRVNLLRSRVAELLPH